METNIDLIADISQKNIETVVQWRRHLHQHPELSFEEFDTSDFVANRLTEMGYEVKRNIGGTGVMATLYTYKEGPTIAFRADMDALPILEETGLEFESQRVGVMHGCGHDGHMAIVLGTALLVSEIKDKLSGTIKFIFQPGEEANGGALSVINDGALANPDVEAIFGLHMMPNLPVGTIGIKEGYLSATDDEFTIKVHGRGAHSSEPEVGINAISIAGQIINGLMTILACNVSPHTIGTFSICKISGGEAINVIPDYVEMQGMIRCIEKNQKIIIREKMKAIVEGVAKGMGSNAEINFISGFPSVNNDPKYTQVTIEAARKALENQSDIVMIEKPHLGSEDFAYYQEEIPGVMFMLGCENLECDTSTLHSCSLNINEDSFEHGIKIFANVALDLCGVSINK